MPPTDKSMGFSILGVSKGLDKLGRELEQLSRTVERLNRQRATPEIDADTRKAEAKIGAFARDLQSKVERAVRSLPEVQLRADSSPVDRRIAEIRRELATLSSKRIGVDIDAGQAQAQINRLSSELARLSTRSANVQVRADTAAASAALLGVSSLARRIDGQTVAISVNASDVSRAISLLGLLTAALAGASALVGPAAAGLAALGPMAAAGAQGIGALAAGFSGVGDAVKALSQAETKAAAGTATSAASRVNSAQAIAGAQRQVERAVLAADRAAIQGAQQVEDARRGVADAYTQGARQIAQAEQQVRQAQLAVTDAQLDLNRARLDAIERNEELGLSLRDVAIGEREALLDLREAQSRLAEGQAGGKSGDELERLKISVERAELSLDRTRERFGDLRQESAEYARTGVEGSREVVAAQRQVADAAQGVREAEAGLAQARSDSARQVADAQRQVQRAVQQASWAQQDAAASIADAQRALSSAYADTGTQGAAGLNKVKEAMEGLSPEAQRFAKFLVGEVLPGLRGIRDGVQATLLPRLELGLRNVEKLAPTVRTELSDTGRVIGDLAVKGSEMALSGPFRRDFATIMDSNNRVLGSFGAAGLSTADSFRHLSVESGPMVERFAALTAQAAQQADTFLTSARATGELDRFFDEMGDTILELVHVGGQIVTMFIQVSQALGPFGMVLLEAAGNLAELIGNFAEAHPQLTQFAAAALIAVTVLAKLGSGVQALSLVAGSAIAGWKTLGDALARVSPAGIAQSATMQRVAGGLNAAELAAGRYTDRLFTSTTAAERAATTGARLGTVVTRAASVLPVAAVAVGGLALAWDGLVISADEAAKAMLEGGAAAEQAAQQLQAQSRVAEALKSGWVLSIPIVGAWAGIFADKLSPGVSEANEKLREMEARMSPLQLAQRGAADAAFAYSQAVKEHGPTSTQAAAAAAVLATATDKVEQENRQADQAMLNLNDRIKQQQDLMLGATNAELAYRNALQGLTDGLTQNGMSFDMNTAAGRANLGNLTAVIEASGRFRQSLIDQGHSEGFATQKAWEHRDALVASMVQAGMTRDAAQALIDKYMKVPPRLFTKVELDTNDADRRLNTWRASVEGRPVRVVLNAVSPQGVPVRQLMQATGGVVDPLARGGIRPMSNRYAQVVPPNTPRLMGDRIRGREYFLPDDDAPRTMAIGAQWAHDRGLALVPLAGGGALGSAPGVPVLGGDTGSGDLFGPLAKSAEELTAAGLRPLADELSATTVPALQGLQRHAGTDTPGALRLLTQACTTSGQQIQATWTANTAAVTTAQQQQTAQQQTLATNLTGATQRMSTALTVMQGRHNASWLDMRVRSGAEIAQITGPQFGGLHMGMDAVQNHATNMAGWVGGQFGRIRQLTADPIRWSIDFPINRGLIPAWAAIDRHFALNRPMGPVPVGFATGGVLPGYTPGRDVHDFSSPSGRRLRLSGGEAVMRPEWTRAVGSGYVDSANEAARRGGIPAVRRHMRDSIDGLAGGGLVEAYAYGGVRPHVAAAGQEIERLFGRMPGGIGGVGSRGNVSDHPSGLALDFMTLQNTPLGNRVAGHLQSRSQQLLVKYLIWQQKINEGGGWQGMANRGSPTANHLDHVHASFLPLGGAGRIFTGGGGFEDPIVFLNQALANTRRMIADIRRFHGAGNIPAAMERLGNNAVQGAIDLALRSYAPTDVPGAGVERWRPTVHTALDMQNQPRAYDNITLRRMQKESGGNARAINLTDSNARKGIPSKGLMQVIDPTFSRYWDPRTPKDIWNPLSNIAASMRYAVARYGSLPTAYNRPGGYDQGGIAAKAGWLWKGTNLPERVLDPRTTVAFERLVSVLDTKRGATPIIVSAPAGQASMGAAGGGVDWRAAAPVIRAAFTASLREVLGEGIKTDVDYDRLAWKLNKVAVLNQRR